MRYRDQVVVRHLTDPMKWFRMACGKLPAKGCALASISSSYGYFANSWDVSLEIIAKSLEYFQCCDIGKRRNGSGKIVISKLQVLSSSTRLM